MASSSYAPVSSIARDRAVVKLENRGWLEVSRTEAEDLVAPAPLPGEGHTFLLRGLCVGCSGTGGFYLYRGNGTVVVTHASLAHRDTPETRWPIVAVLPESPSEVFVDATADE